MFSRFFHKLPLRLRSLFLSRAVDRELDEELRGHLEMKIEDLVRRGVPEHQAAIMARREFGNLTTSKEECREARNFVWLENFQQDFRHGFRALRRNAGFSIIAVLTLALGIGATSALFSLVDASLLHPVTAPQADRLIWLQEIAADRSQSGSSPARLNDWQHARSFSALGGFYSENAVFPTAAGLRQLQVLRTTGDVIGALKPKLQAGRGFTMAESRGDGPLVALLTDRTFREQFHANPAILNSTLRLSGAGYQVIGILNADFDYPDDIDVWTPASAEIQTASRAAGFLGVVGRLSPGASLNQAQAEIDVLAQRMAKQYPDTDQGRSAVIVGLAERVGREVRKPLLVLFGAVAGILLIGCLNISGLLLARGLMRRREAAIRVAAGARPGRLMRLFFAESLLLAGAGCIGGLAIAYAGIQLLKRVLPPQVPHLAAAALDMRVVLCGIALSIAAAFVFGALPAWQFAAAGQAFALREGGAGSVGARRNNLRNLLVVSEVVVSVVLLVVASLLANSFLKLRGRSLGFDSARAYVFSLNLPWDTNAKVLNSVSADTIAALNSLPGAISAGVVDRLPLQGGSQSALLLVRGKTLSPALAQKEFGYRTASAGFFAATGIPILSGHPYRDWQGGQGNRETVISQRLAETLFPGLDPIGQEIASNPRGDKRDPQWFRVVGVAGSVLTWATDPEPAAELYIPWGATYWPMMNFVVRTDRPLSDVARFVHDSVQKLSPDQVFSSVTSLDQRVAATRSSSRPAVLLVGGFAIVALSLAALGIFGLMAHETMRRTQEIGVRLALGAEPRSIALDSTLRGVKLAAVGLCVGLVIAWFASSLLESLLFGTTPHDAGSYALAGLVLLLAATLASLWPALRAARIDPIRALRHE